MSEPTPDAAVRTARLADADAVGQVQAAAWRAAYADLLGPEALEQVDAEAFAAQWSASLATPPGPVYRLLVATEGPELVGLVAVGPAEDDDAIEVADSGAADGGEDRPLVGEVLTIAVHPDHLRRGHGSRLLNAAVDTLRANDRTVVHLWLPEADTATRTFVEVAGLASDGAARERVVDESGRAVREVRLTARLDDEQPPG